MQATRALVSQSLSNVPKTTYSNGIDRPNVDNLDSLVNTLPTAATLSSKRGFGPSILYHYSTQKFDCLIYSKTFGG